MVCAVLSATALWSSATAMTKAEASAALPVQGVPCTVRRPDRHGAGRTSSATARVGIVLLSDGAEPLQPADRRGTWPVPFGGPGHDRASSPWSGQLNPDGQT